MSRLTVIMPDEITIRSKGITELSVLAADAEIPIIDLPEENIVELLLTTRAIFDGRHFETDREELIALHKQLFGEDEDVYELITPFIAYECALYFWPNTVTPVANATASPTNAPAPAGVLFNSDTSTGTITRWHWQFGDGGESWEQNPGYVYETPGFWIATLTVYNHFGVNNSDTVSILITEPPVAGTGEAITTETGVTITTETGEVITVDPGT